jgi:hypothetical protein
MGLTSQPSARPGIYQKKKRLARHGSGKKYEQQNDEHNDKQIIQPIHERILLAIYFFENILEHRTAIRLLAGKVVGWSLPNLYRYLCYCRILMSYF